MKNYFIIFTFIILNNIYAQNANSIISKNLEVTGGEKPWVLLHSIIIKGKVIFSVTEEYPIHIFQKRPNYTHSSIIIDKKQIVLEAFDGKNAYKTNFYNGNKEVIKNYSSQSFDSDLLQYSTKGFKAKYLGKENADGKLCYKVELKKNTNATYYFFDIENYQLIKEDNKDESISYSDFRKVGDLVFPFKIESKNKTGEGDYLLYISEIKTNQNIADKIFNY